jgi:hypothetical protein
VTPGRALDFPTLSGIPADQKPLRSHISIKELKNIAIDRIYQAVDSNEAPLVPNFHVELFLTQCALHTTDEKETTLAHLGCNGSFEQPLNIFVIPTSGVSGQLDTPHDLWGFQCSDRGIATLQTCLKVLMAEATKASALRRLLKIVFNITHFPPALEALHVLGTENRLIPSAVAILATCFRELALRMVPGGLVGKDIKSVLEGSRQICAWVDSEYRGTLDEVDDPETSLVREVKFEELVEGTEQSDYQPGKKSKVVEIEAAGDPMSSSSSSVERRTRKVKVLTRSNCKEDLRLLALAMWGRYNELEDYYVDFRDSIDRPFDHRRTPTVDYKEFHRLLTAANASPQFRMTAPKDLDTTFTNAITLSEKGYVSIYHMNVGYFKDLQPSTWNAITGTDILDTNPGQTILRALEPIMKQRKLDGTWEVDDWEYTGGHALDLASPQEAVVICFDLSSSMNDNLGYSWIGASNSMSKLTEAKQVFENVIARMVGYHLISNYVGLVTFSSPSRIHVSMELSRLSKDFKDMMGDRNATGCTALWDALNRAKEMLIAFKAKNPTTKLRIIALTDGEDNDSETKPEELCQGLYEADIVLDSLVIGSVSTSHLFRMSKHTGGYAFRPTSRLLLFQTFLLEPFLDISARPEIEKIPITDYSASTPKKPDMVSVYDFPPCRPHHLQSGSFISLSNASRFFATRSAPLVGQRSSIFASLLIPPRGRTPGAFSSVSTLVPSSNLNRSPSDTFSVRSDRSTMSTGRVFMNEIVAMTANENRWMEVYVNEMDMSFWKIVLEGPPSSPYEGGTFLLYVHMTETFPQTPPVVRFITPILHPNITKVRARPSLHIAMCPFE